MSSSAVRAIQRHYPQMYFACHVNHVRTRSNRHHLSAHDAKALTHVAELAPTTPSALARHLDISASTLSATLKRLATLGHLTRQPSLQDRRRQELRLTPKGAAALAATSVLDPRRIAAVLRELTPAQRKQAIAGLALLADAARSFQSQAPRRPRW